MAAPDFPASPTVGQIYTAPSGIQYTWDGKVWSSSSTSQSWLWTDTGTTLTPYDATKTVSVPTSFVLTGGSAQAAKGRLLEIAGNDMPVFSYNVNWSGSAWVRDDTTKGASALFYFGNATPPRLEWDYWAAGAGGAFVSLLQVDNAGNLTTTGAVRCAKGVQLTGATTTVELTANDPASPSYDAAKASFKSRMDYGGFPNVGWDYRAAGGSYANVGYLDYTGNFVIVGTTGQKASGTTWSNPSDPRLKQDVAPYSAGLADICQLAPITYRLKSQGPDGPLCYGFDAEKVRDVFPECVSTTKMKLPGDEEETEDVLVFDMHPILVALINAVKELAAKIG